MQLCHICQWCHKPYCTCKRMAVKLQRGAGNTKWVKLAVKLTPKILMSHNSFCQSNRCTFYSCVIAHTARQDNRNFYKPSLVSKSLKYKINCSGNREVRWRQRAEQLLSVRCPNALSSWMLAKSYKLCLNQMQSSTSSAAIYCGPGCDWRCFQEACKESFVVR